MSGTYREIGHIDTDDPGRVDVDAETGGRSPGRVLLSCADDDVPTPTMVALTVGQTIALISLLKRAAREVAASERALGRLA